MAGYLKDTRLGAVTYNLGHNYVLALAVIGVGLLADSLPVAGIGLILSAHVGLDRAMLFGLKYPSAFKDTHLHVV
jgi:hypothetical protein